MRLLSIFVSCLVATAFARSIRAPNQDPIAISDADEVPGDNPLVYCDDPKDNILSIDHADLTPQDVKPGANITLELAGELSEEVKNGTVHFSVKGKIGNVWVPLLSQDGDLCEQLNSTDNPCPVSKGDVSFVQKFTIPDEAPKITYAVRAEYKNDEEERITCVEATVSLAD